MERLLALSDARWSASPSAALTAADQSLVTFRSLWGQAVDRLLASLARSFSSDRSMALLSRVPGR
jgi:hypothetical protein